MPDIIYTKSHVLNFTLILIYISHHTVNIPSSIPSLFTDATIYVHKEEIENEKNKFKSCPPTSDRGCTHSTVMTPETDRFL